MLTRAPGAGEPTVARLGVIGADTVHIDVIDRWGNMVSRDAVRGLAAILAGGAGAGVPDGHAGADVLAAAGLPNSLAPGKRPRTTLSPSFALRDGEPWMAFGTPGGEQQDQWSLTFFLRMVHGTGWASSRRSTCRRFHTEHWPSSFWPRVARPGKVVLEGRCARTCWRRCWPAGTWRSWARTGPRAGCRRRGRRGGDAVRRRQPARHAGLRGGALRASIRAAYWLGVWLLSPSRGALLLKCMFAGVVLKLLSLLLIPPLLLFSGGGGVADAAVPAFGQAEVVMAVAVAPVLETLMMAAVFGAAGRVFGERPAIPVFAVVAGAVMLHADDLVTRGFVLFMFAALSVQYARFRALLGLGPAVVGVAVTHATVNMLGVAVGLAAAR